MGLVLGPAELLGRCSGFARLGQLRSEALDLGAQFLDLGFACREVFGEQRAVVVGRSDGRVVPGCSCGLSGPAALELCGTRRRVQLIDGTRFFQRMKKSLNNKRQEITDEQIRQLTRLYGNFRDGETAEVAVNGRVETRVVSRIFENREFGFLRITVERPLRMNFEATPERLARLDAQTAFANLATSKKRKNTAAAEREIEEGQRLQENIRTLLTSLAPNGRYMDRETFEADVKRAAKRDGVKVPAPILKAVFAALGERDPAAEICRDGKGRPEPDPDLRDTENIPLPESTALPLPLDFGPDKPHDRLVAAFRNEIDAYLLREVLPHVPDAWVDYDKTKVGYEIPFNRYFYVYEPPRPLKEIEADIAALEGEIAELLEGLSG